MTPLAPELTSAPVKKSFKKRNLFGYLTRNLLAKRQRQRDQSVNCLQKELEAKIKTLLNLGWFPFARNSGWRATSRLCHRRAAATASRCALCNRRWPLCRAKIRSSRSTTPPCRATTPNCRSRTPLCNRNRPRSSPKTRVCRPPPRSSAQRKTR